MSSETHSGAYYAQDTRNWRQRMMSRLFPARHLEPPDDAEGFAAGSMRTEVYIRMDIWDRLRALVSGRLRVTVLSQTDVAIGKVRSSTMFWIAPPATGKEG
jgi:predicted anti-sigma-YlaC factor YlaD